MHLLLAKMSGVGKSGGGECVVLIFHVVILLLDSWGLRLVLEGVLEFDPFRNTLP